MERIKPEKCKVCRLCLTQSVVCHSLLQEDRAILLESLTSIKVDEDESLPTNACIKCLISLRYAVQIQQNILEANRKLRLLDDTDEFITLGQINLKHDTEEENDEEQPEPDLDEFFSNDPQKFVKTDGGINTVIFENIKIENTSTNQQLAENDIVIKSEYDEDTRDSITGVIEDTTTQECYGKVPCKICGLEFVEKDLMEHIKYHYFSSVKCDECNMPCENIHTYRQHLAEEHKDVNTEKNWVCKTCKVSFLYKPLYIIHFKSAHPVKAKDPPVSTPGIYPCSYCKKRFYNEKRRNAHSAVHKKKQCDICGVYITPTNFPAHRKSHLEEAVECPICGRKYKNTVSLKGHIHYTHSQRTYMCEFCDKTFKKSYSLLLHIKREHTGEKSHVCDLCGKSFLTFYNLSKHKKMTHQKLRPFQCEYCQKKFSSKFALRTHERQHTLDAPYECDKCGQCFRQKVSLRSHRKSVHNIEEPLTCACEVCGKKFSSRFAVMSHMRLH